MTLLADVVAASQHVSAIDADDVRDTSELAKWVELGASYARSLPAKR